MAKKIGEVTHYFTDLGVAIVELVDDLRVGDKVAFRGHTTDFEQEVGSIEVDRKKIEEASSGDAVGLKVRERDKVFLT